MSYLRSGYGFEYKRIGLWKRVNKLTNELFRPYQVILITLLRGMLIYHMKTRKKKKTRTIKTL